jgi:hypothetical protein
LDVAIYDHRIIGVADFIQKPVEAAPMSKLSFCLIELYPALIPTGFQVNIVNPVQADIVIYDYLVRILRVFPYRFYAKLNGIKRIVICYED